MTIEGRFCRANQPRYAHCVVPLCSCCIAKGRSMSEISTGGAPAVSVIIPVYNCVAYLPECLDSVIAQTESSWEIICVDDGSTDDVHDQQRRRALRYMQIHACPHLGLTAPRPPIHNPMIVYDCENNRPHCRNTARMENAGSGSRFEAADGTGVGCFTSHGGAASSTLSTSSR